MVQMRKWRPLLRLEEGASQATYRKIAEGLVNAILEGRLPPGTLLPGTREMAHLLDVNRKTAELLGLEDAILVDLDHKNVLLDCANEVIRTCVEDFVGDDAAAMSFLETWSNADWDQLRAEFPEANDLVYAADPSWEGWNR